ncbi:MAG: hypothetical protein J6B98_05280 [Bacilli bacterium]|nr:hypothetical protein [Bacilli bacterium]
MKKSRYMKDIVRFLLELEGLIDKYKIGNDPNIISLKDLKLLNIHGNEYVIFKYLDKVVKIHRRKFVDIDNLDEQNILSFINLPTKRILMPTDALYDIDGRIKGYVMDFIDNEKSLSNESMDHILNEARIIEEDKKILDEKGILLQDLHEGNAMYNGKINIVDSGRYINTNVMLPTYMYLTDKTLMKSLKKSDLENLKEKVIKTNTLQVNYFIYRFIMNSILDNSDDFEMYTYMSRVLEHFNEYTEKLKTTSFVDVMESECSKDMTVEEYVKTLMKKVDTKY